VLIHSSPSSPDAESMTSPVERLRSECSEGWNALNGLGTIRSRSANERRVRKLGEAERPLWFKNRRAQGTLSSSAERENRKSQRKIRTLQEGFTLLEVLVAIAILGLGLTVILSSQVGLFTSTSRGAHLTVASNLLRCKMSEIELTLDQKGFSLTDENDEGECCADEGEGYTCTWKIERVELPPLPQPSMDQDGGAPPAGSAGLALGGPGAFGATPGSTPLGAAPGGLGALGALAGLGAPGAGLAPGGKADPASIMSQLGSGSGTSGMEGMVMGLVYPSLKPMLEASIRRVTVKVMWKEGLRPRDLQVTQFLTRPQEGMLGTSEQVGLDQTVNAMQGLMGITGAGTTPGATTGTTGTTTPRTGSILNK
jgi:general secretion pathway protein I